MDKKAKKEFVKQPDEERNIISAKKRKTNSPNLHSHSKKTVKTPYSRWRLPAVHSTEA